MMNASKVMKPAWLVGGSMLRISLSFFYGLGSVLRPIYAITPGIKLGDVWTALYSAESELNNLLTTSWFTPAMKTASYPGQRLAAALKLITDRTDFDGELSPTEVRSLTTPLTEFETVLKNELFIADTYFVTQKSWYDTGTLVSNAEQNFPSDLGIKVPRSIVDLREAGKCLAFELSTAAGFHVIRGTETVVRNYWTAVSKGKAHPRLKTIGNYAAEMEKHSLGNNKVVAALKQISTLHRNPLIHPDVSLSLDDAIDIFGICRSAIGAMLKDIPTHTGGVSGTP